MPLNKSGSKKAFSENVRTEMHHGKPQKQAVAIAYDVMRRAGHKMSSGGECMACGGSCKYADGGSVQGPVLPGAESFVKSFRGAHADGGMVKEYAGGGRINIHEKGVHDPDPFSEGGGESTPGRWIREKQPERMHESEKEKQTSRNMNLAKSVHKEKLETLKSMPNPKLKGLSEGGKVYSVGPMKDTRQPSHAALTAYAKGGPVENMSDMDKDMKEEDMPEHEDHELHEGVAKEMMEHMKKGDHKGFLDGLKALIMSMKE